MHISKPSTRNGLEKTNIQRKSSTGICVDINASTSRVSPFFLDIEMKGEEACQRKRDKEDDQQGNVRPPERL